MRATTARRIGTRPGAWLASLAVILLLAPLGYGGDGAQWTMEASGALGQVRVVYAIPTDRTYRADYVAAITSAVSSIRSWYAGQLDGETFHVVDEVPVTCALPQASSYYVSDSFSKVVTDLQSCVAVGFGSSTYAWIIYADVMDGCNTPGRLGVGADGLTILGRHDLDGLIGAPVFDGCGVQYFQPITRYIGGLGHELGHVFGLPHPPGCDAGLPSCDGPALMWWGYSLYPNTYLRTDEKPVVKSSRFIDPALDDQVPIDFDATGTGDVLLYQPATGSWSIQGGRVTGGFDGVPGAWSPGWSVHAARFDHDARTDVFLINDTTGQWFRMLGTGTGFTVADTGFWTPGWTVHVTDLDGDGLSDVFLNDPDTGVWFRCLSTGSGFTYHQGIWSPGWQLLLADLNSDPQQDFFLFSPTTGQWFWVLGTAGGGFTYPLSGFWSTGWNLVPGDFNGDRLTDVLLHDPATGVWFVAATGGSGFSYTSGFWSLGFAPQVFDFDGNGAADLFLNNPATGQWYSMRSLGNGTFLAAFWGFWSVGWEMRPGDFDGDGYEDLLLYNPQSGVWFQAQSEFSGQFTYAGGIWSPQLTIVTGLSGR